MSRIALCMLACSALFAVALAGNIMASHRRPSFKDVDQQCVEAKPTCLGACGKIKDSLTKKASQVVVDCNAELHCARRWPGNFKAMGNNQIFKEPGSKPLDGTKCGDGKICTGGLCVNGTVPKQKSGSYTCWMRYMTV